MGTMHFYNVTRGLIVIKIYFDESGNTGCVVPNKNNDLYNDGQRHFVLCGVIAFNDEDDQTLRTQYDAFKKKFHLTDKFKGSDLLTRENNAMLNYFIDNLIDEKHFHICCYDKIYYLATMISLYFFGIEARNEDPLTYYTQASALALEDISFFKTFCSAVSENTADSRRRFIQFVAAFDFKHIDRALNNYIVSAEALLDVFRDEPVPEFPLTYGSYLKSNITNMINLTALGEILLSIKEDYKEIFQNVEAIHDHILEFENDFIDAMKDTCVNLAFADSKDELLIQYADNVASVFRKLFTQTVTIFRSGTQWEDNSQWFPTQLAKLLNKITYSNLKLVNPICDCVLPFCVQEMFDESFPIECRNNSIFANIFAKQKVHVLECIKNTNYNIFFKGRIEK